MFFFWGAVHAHFFRNSSDGRLAEELKTDRLLLCRLPEQAGHGDWSMPEPSFLSSVIHVQCRIYPSCTRVVVAAQRHINKSGNVQKHHSGGLRELCFWNFGRVRAGGSSKTIRGRQRGLRVDGREERDRQRSFVQAVSRKVQSTQDLVYIYIYICILFVGFLC